MAESLLPELSLAMSLHAEAAKERDLYLHLLRRLNTAVKRYVHFQGPCSPHHRDDCPDPVACAGCLTDKELDAALEAVKRYVE